MITLQDIQPLPTFEDLVPAFTTGQKSDADSLPSAPTWEDILVDYGWPTFWRSESEPYVMRNVREPDTIGYKLKKAAVVTSGIAFASFAKLIDLVNPATYLNGPWGSAKPGPTLPATPTVITSPSPDSAGWVQDFLVNTGAPQTWFAPPPTSWTQDFLVNAGVPQTWFAPQKPPPKPTRNYKKWAFIGGGIAAVTILGYAVTR